MVPRVSTTYDILIEHDWETLANHAPWPFGRDCQSCEQTGLIGCVLFLSPTSNKPRCLVGFVIKIKTMMIIITIKIIAIVYRILIRSGRNLTRIKSIFFCCSTYDSVRPCLLAQIPDCRDLQRAALIGADQGNVYICDETFQGKNNRACHPGGHYWDYNLGALYSTHWGRVTHICVSKLTTIVSDKQRVLMHRHQGWNVRHGLCHINMRYLYIYIYELFIAFVCFVVCSLL